MDTITVSVPVWLMSVCGWTFFGVVLLGTVVFTIRSLNENIRRESGKPFKNPWKMD